MAGAIGPPRAEPDRAPTIPQLAGSRLGDKIQWTSPNLLEPAGTACARNKLSFYGAVLKVRIHLPPAVSQANFQLGCLRRSGMASCPTRHPRFRRLFGSARVREEGSPDGAPLIQARHHDCVEAEAAAVMVSGEDQHQHQQEEIGPGPFPGRAVETEPEIEDL